MAVEAKLSKTIKLQKTKEGLLVKDSKRQSFLITFYTPRQGDSVVLLQASHSNRSLRFPNLESTFEYLEHQAQKNKQLEDP